MMRWLIYFVGVVFLIVLANASVAEYQLTAQTNTVEEKSPAQLWYDSQEINANRMSQMPPMEAAVRLNQAVYTFCRNGLQPKSIDDLFTNCTTQCGGYSYVLGKLLTVIGINNRLVHLHNIPNQGNHTAVEAKIGGKWMFLDPTFGAYFTENGEHMGSGLSLSDLSFKYRNADLSTHVLQSRKIKEDLRVPLDILYGEKFSHKYMVLRNYQVAETVSRAGDNLILNLDIPLEIVDGSANIGAQDQSLSESKLAAIWLGDTQATLNDAHPLNDTSFNANYIFPRRITTVSIYNIEPQREYQMVLIMSAYFDDQKIQMSGVGKGVILDVESVIGLHKGPQKVTFKLVSKRPFAQLMFTPIGSSKARLLGVSITAGRSTIINHQTAREGHSETID